MAKPESLFAGAGVCAGLALAAGLWVTQERLWAWAELLLAVVAVLLGVAGLVLSTLGFIGLHQRPPIPAANPNPIPAANSNAPISVPLEAPFLDLPPPTPSPLKAASERVFTDATEERLVGLYEGQHAIQAAKLIEAYIGKWLTVSGPLGDVGVRLSYGSQVTFGPREDRALVLMWFREQQWIDRLAVTERGREIVVIGMIEKITSTYVSLDHCELVN